MLLQRGALAGARKVLGSAGVLVRGAHTRVRFGLGMCIKGEST